MVKGRDTLLYDEFVHETDSAYLFSFAGKEVWLPKSMCLEPSGICGSGEGTVEVEEWLVTEKELDFFII